MKGQPGKPGCIDCVDGICDLNCGPAVKADIPADRQRHPSGCPDPDWCSGNRICYWNCRNDGRD